MLTRKLPMAYLIKNGKNSIIKAISDKIESSLTNQLKSLEKLDKYCKYLEKNKIELITYKNKDYPYKLKHITDLPAYIFVKGDKNILDDDSVAIIGSRLCSEAGKKIAFNTAKELGDKNVNVVSGLANRNRYLCTYGKLKK